MERIDQLEKEVRILSISVRAGTGVLIAGFASQCCFMLSRVDAFRTIFKDLLGPDSKLPSMTIFFMNNAMMIMIALVIIGVLTIFILGMKRTRVWSVPLGVAVALITIVTAQFATYSLELPLIGIISQLSK